MFNSNNGINEKDHKTKKCYKKNIKKNYNFYPMKCDQDTKKEKFLNILLSFTQMNKLHVKI